ncbi:MAG: uridine kinase [Actinomycetota bacterium]|nr:uridine kinase [Actinomycetota bacterium]
MDTHDGQVHARSTRPDRLVDDLADWIAATAPERWLRVAIDGAPPAAPGELADALVDPVRRRGRPVVRVVAADFLRPASLRLERGRTDPDAYYEDRLDFAALAREVLAPLAPGGTGRYLPSRWDTRADRATRAAYRIAPPRAVLLLDGELLLGRGLPLDSTVHLALSPAALARRVDSACRWVLPAYERYSLVVRPQETADVVVRVDDPRRPALVLRDPPPSAGCR